ncbi:acetolactate synthase large subunit [Pseudomonas sp. FP597]|uniref:Acetolactate synthase large subunit n=1 Tax=Pseudomonas lactucae TaxID=2813360 RepID=A0A9X0YCP8_9PSED|nr:MULTISPECIES: acetolactate synthase large subunit [Pseudomonas]MBN2977191.1 acetolactate synthase large subunit [Pseudomonas lactucae]MBN2989467.1 acetolactate synthase large subunit [Pseudomonas lactucae]WLI08786.1 acetolactate synthase large subunit [Pseudomonas sp. FP597]
MTINTSVTEAVNGAQSLVQTLDNCGVEVCFGNPGTSEMHFVAALDSVPGMRSVLCLFEGVATGAADGYGRIAGKPAATLLHLGPGLANGLANLHNARRANTPIVNIVGDHATYHLQYDALLTSDIVGFARPVSSWIHESKNAKTVAVDAARAVQAARSAPGGVATLILPADTAWEVAEHAVGPIPDSGMAKVSDKAIERSIELLKNGKKTAILLRGAVLHGAGLEAAGRVQAATGARLLCDTFAPHVELGAGRVAVERIPYFAEQITAFLQDIEQLILVGSKPPVSFFAYPGKSSWCTPDGCIISYLAHPHEDSANGMISLAEELKAPAHVERRVPLILPDLPSGRLTVDGVARAIAHLTPDNAIIADESATSGIYLLASMATARPHTHLPLTGGSIGQGLPLAIGAAIAAPDRKVVCPHGDGGAAYTLQALWTMAREQLDVTVVIYANRSYAILNIELMRVGVVGAGSKALSMLDLHNPELDWVKIAQGFGVEASRATTAEEFNDMYLSAMRGHGPRLIEAVV